MSSPCFESDNVNDILRVAQKTTLYNFLFRNSHNQSIHQQAWLPIYQNDAANPTAFRSEVDTTLPGGYESVTWPDNVAAEDNPFGLVCVQNDPVFDSADLALVIQIDNYDGWTEGGGIGV